MNNYWKKYNDDISLFFEFKARALIHRCKRNNIIACVNYEDLMDIYSNQNGKCFYTDEQLICKFREGTHPHTLSIDRIIPEKGYIKNNIVLCCFRINAIKSNLSLDEMKIILPVFYDKLVAADKI